MLSKLFSKWGKKSEPHPAPAETVAPLGEEVPETPPFTRWMTFGDHLYRQGERCDVVFVREDGTRKTIVNNAGEILDFPGIETGSWTQALSADSLPAPVVRFRTEFQSCGEGQYRMVWQIQPDGMYWRDERGFGITNDEEVRLCARIDRQGDFLGPFRIYSIGSETFPEAQT